MIAWVEVPASTKEGPVTVLVDVTDWERLAGRSLSIGSHGYAQLFADGKVDTLHRWLMGARGLGYKVIVDHINRDKLDNRRANLRLVDPSLSNINRADSENPYRGVYETRQGRFAARIKWHRRIINLGTFDDRDEAAVVINEYRRQHLPETLPPNAA